MTTYIAEQINRKLIELLLSIPFPYNDILKQQIEASTLSSTETPYVYSIHFHLAQSAQRFPEWLDIVPLSWQILVDNVPVTCELFLDNGYIEDLEIVDMGFERIQWDCFFDTSPCLDFEYSERHVYEFLSSESLILEKARNDSMKVDLLLKSSGKSIVASFRGCQTRRLDLSKLPAQVVFEISEAKEKEYKYTIRSSDGNIDFDCALLFLKLHAVIG